MSATLETRLKEAAANGINNLAQEDASKDQDATGKTPRFRFTLGSIFGIILSFALVLGWFTQIMIPQQKQAEEAVSAMATYGGMGYTQSWSPFGISVTLNLQYSQIPVAGIRELAANPTVVSLDLSHTGITDEDLQVLQNMENLHTLRVVETSATPEGIARLRAARPDLEVIVQE